MANHPGRFACQPHELTTVRTSAPFCLQDLDDIDTYDSSVINCLQDYSGEIKNAECKSQVKKYLQLAAQDIRFDVPLAEACYEDRQKYCANVPPVGGVGRVPYGETAHRFFARSAELCSLTRLFLPD